MDRLTHVKPVSELSMFHGKITALIMERKDRMRLKCIHCPATAENNSKERGRFQRRHGGNCRELKWRKKNFFREKEIIHDDRDEIEREVVISESYLQIGITK